jgi:hypothetical protein
MKKNLVRRVFNLVKRFFGAIGPARSKNNQALIRRTSYNQIPDFENDNEYRSLEKRLKAEEGASAKVRVLSEKLYSIYLRDPKSQNLSSVKELDLRLDVRLLATKIVLS